MENDSLDKVETVVEGGVEGDDSLPQLVPDFSSAPRGPLLSKKRLAIAAAIILLLAIISLEVMLTSKRPSTTTTQKTTSVTINTQTLDSGTLTKLSGQAGTGGTQTTQLTITPQTLFKNGILVQGASSIDGNLAIRGSLSVTGSLSATSLNVGSLVVTNVSASGNLQFNGHLVPSGTVPTAKPSNGTSGGTVTVSGNDTAGTVTINIGNGTLVAGEMAIITFHSPFTTTPKVQLTPVNAASAALNYYTSRSATFFAIETATTPANGGSYVFDYLVTQ